MISSNLSATNLKADLARYARSLGFERFGVTSAVSLLREQESLSKWVSEGRAATMEYMKKDPERRADPRLPLPNAKSVIALAMTYELAGDGEKPPAWQPADYNSNEGRVARYVSGTDYHKSMGKKLQSFVRYMEAIAPSHESRLFVDTGPLLERAFAQRAGVGFVGKNTMLITKGLGSWVFLASVVTSLELPTDAPDDRSCGECRLCIDACPTQAITGPYQLDARLCIAYLTIEHRGAVEPSLRGKTGEWVFGCDVCQDVCPHNTGRTPRPQSISLRDILSLKDEEDFKEQFAGTALTRTGRQGLIRNACLAAGNLQRRDLLPQLKVWAEDADTALSDCAAWAIEQLQSS